MTNDQIPMTKEVTQHQPWLVIGAWWLGFWTGKSETSQETLLWQVNPNSRRRSERQSSRRGRSGGASFAGVRGPFIGNSASVGFVFV